MHSLLYSMYTQKVSSVVHIFSCRPVFPSSLALDVFTALVCQGFDLENLFHILHHRVFFFSFFLYSYTHKTFVNCRWLWPSLGKKVTPPWKLDLTTGGKISHTVRYLLHQPILEVQCFFLIFFFFFTWENWSQQKKHEQKWLSTARFLYCISLQTMIIPFEFFIMIIFSDFGNCELLTFCGGHQCTII